MNCATAQSDNLVERYVLGRLSDGEQRSFEEHFFVCEACFEEVRLMQTLQAVGKKHSRPAAVIPMPRRPWLVWGAAAAVLLVGAGVYETMRTRRPELAQTVAVAHPPIADPQPELDVLARVVPPVYTASNLRSSVAGREQKFRAAMAMYAGGDYADAAKALRPLTEGGPETAAARFYLAVADLLAGNSDEATAQLRSVDAMGETPYQEQARFFLAKALLASRDVAGAAQALQRTIQLRGDREAEARQLLEQVLALPRSQ